MNDDIVKLIRENNFHNVIRKKFEYLERNSNSNRVQVIQEMAECGLCFEVPIYLLYERCLNSISYFSSLFFSLIKASWKSYFRDTINSLNHYLKLLKTESTNKD